MTSKTFLVTGGAGFIGSALVRSLIADNHKVVNVDKLTYAGNLSSLASVERKPNHFFKKLDINSTEAIALLFDEFHPDGVFHLAAETHVDRSIKDAGVFIQSNIVGTQKLLDVTKFYWQELPEQKRSEFKFLHVSTDEVYGSAKPDQHFTEDCSYCPSSPYAASKAASDHLALAWLRTYGLPVIVTHCSNNYGPYQYPEKLIPFFISRALKNESLPVYGDGQHSRDWLHVEDHVKALELIMAKGAIGEVYNIAGRVEKANLTVVGMICDELDKQLGFERDISTLKLISYVTDRRGHDRRYAIDDAKIRDILGWAPTKGFETGLSETVQWYLANQTWVDNILRDQS